MKGHGEKVVKKYTLWKRVEMCGFHEMLNEWIKIKERLWVIGKIELG